jgi:hypothetical protein
MHANNLIFCRKMIDKATKMQISVGFLDQDLFTSKIFLIILAKLAKQSQMQ